MKRYITELIGSFFLVLALGLTGNLLASGLMIVSIIYFGGQLSGAHYNPAVSLAFWATRKMPAGEFWAYLSSQVAGTLVGCLFLFYLAGTTLQFSPADDSSPALYASVELLFAVILAMVYLIVFLTRDSSKDRLFGLVAGLSYAGLLMVGQPVSGGVFNPALAATSSIIDLFSQGDSWVYLPAYLLGPLAGGVIAGLLFNSLYQKAEPLLWEE